MARFWQQFSKRQRLSAMVLLSAVLIIAVFFTYADVPYENLPLPQNVRDREQQLERLRKELAQLKRFETKQQALVGDLREQAAPFWRSDDKASAADVQNELDRLARRAQVTIQSTRLAREKPEKYTDYVLSVEVSVQMRAPMREISRLLAELEKSEKTFTWKTCSLRPDNTKDPKQVYLSGRLEALLLTPEATQLIYGNREVNP